MDVGFLYQFRVTAFNEVGESDPSNEDWVNATDYQIGPNEVWIHRRHGYPPPLFQPDTCVVCINRDMTVSWLNRDDIAHTVISGSPGNPDGVFSSGNIAPEGNFIFTFSTGGSYPYYCALHPSETGMIVVEE